MVPFLCFPRKINPSTSWELLTVFFLEGCISGSLAPLPSAQKLDSVSPEPPPSMGSPLRGVSKPAQQGQSAGCSGQDLLTSNQESMQLL